MSGDIGIRFRCGRSCGLRRPGGYPTARGWRRHGSVVAVVFANAVSIRRVWRRSVLFVGCGLGPPRRRPRGRLGGGQELPLVRCSEMQEGGLVARALHRTGASGAGAATKTRRAVSDNRTRLRSDEGEQPMSERMRVRKACLIAPHRAIRALHMPLHGEENTGEGPSTPKKRVSIDSLWYYTRQSLPKPRIGAESTGGST